MLSELISSKTGPEGPPAHPFVRPSVDSHYLRCLRYAEMFARTHDRKMKDLDTAPPPPLHQASMLTPTSTTDIKEPPKLSCNGNEGALCLVVALLSLSPCDPTDLEGPRETTAQSCDVAPSAAFFGLRVD
ncbi:hypothetical protein AAFF_G00286000 [Aldrovandia affinis]|uniref:Uncharacterized protein n=1 Tax=Aldrovandia affinis TaxID=143900 RepID=A0AAD7X240_9TELE|nr:hypothetical protein AAFF_G00286000 [Aldrovandia affinis]